MGVEGGGVAMVAGVCYRHGYVEPGRHQFFQTLSQLRSLSPVEPRGTDLAGQLVC